MIEIPYEALKIWFDMAQYKPSPEQETLHRELLKPHVGDEGPLPTMVVIFGGEQAGKHVAIETPIATIDGWKQMRDLQVGDMVFDEQGKPTVVQWVSEVQTQPCYELDFDTGETIIASESHQWLCQNYNARKQKYAPKVRTTAELALGGVIRHAPHNKRPFANWSIDAPKPLEIAEDTGLPVPPYVLGAWLGDGSSSSGGFTGIDPEIYNRIESLGYEISHSGTEDKAHYIRGLVGGLREIGVFKCKHIPQRYLRASSEQRLELLRGLMDTDGYVDKKGRTTFTNTNKALVDGFCELLSTLGISFRVHEGRAKLNGKDCGPVWDVDFQTRLQVFHLTRKMERCNPDRVSVRSDRIYITDIRYIGERLVKCIQVEASSHLYLCGRTMVPTHNSMTCGQHVFARWMTDPLIWLVGDRYEDARREYEYCRDSAALCGKAVLKKASYSETGPWELEYTNGHKVKVLASDDVPKLAREAPDGIVMCEPGRQSYEAFRALWRRALPKTAWFAVAGTLEASLGSSRWYGDLYRELQTKNPYGGVGLSLPSYANRSLYPLGKDDPKFKSAVKSVRESNPVDGEEEVGERFLGIPRTPKGLVFSEFSRQIHVSEHADFNPDLEVQLWVDPGYDHAYAILWVQKAGEITNICDEFYLNHMVNDEVLTLVENHPMFPNVTRVVIDVAAKQHAGAQSSAYEAWCSRIGVRGIPIAGQRVEVLEGIIRTHDKLRVSPMTRLPYLRVHPRCRKTIWEFEEGYRLRERRNGDIGSDLPIDKNNDAMKAIAYGIIDNFGYSDIRHPLPKATTVKHSYDRNNRFRRSSYLSR